MGAKLGLASAAVALIGVSTGLAWFVRREPARELTSSVAVPRADASTQSSDPLATDPPGLSFRVPSGDPSTLSCADAHILVRQARSRLAYAPPSVSPSALALATADWLDPHGLWSAAPDSPVPAILDRRADALTRELEGGTPACSAARAVGEGLAKWVDELRLRFRASRQRARTARRDEVEESSAAADPVLETEGSPEPARILADVLGARVGATERALGASVTPYADSAEARFFPDIGVDGWSKVVLAAAVRAYVPLLDPHGAWAALDEEASVYDVDLDAHPPDRLWDRASRTAMGLVVDSDPLEPLQVGDVVLALGGVPTAGLSPEQLEQLAYAVTDTPASAPMVVLRRGERELRTLELPPPPDGGAEETTASLPAYRVGYGAGDALVVEIHDVRSDLGEELASAIHHAQATETRPITGVLLDLRDDGGGSTEGAIAALGLFLPGAPLFPMARRDGAIEVDRAPVPPPRDRWDSAVATLVDGDTASAAEMIAGALSAYHRGPIVGSRTYGKGCAQEYLDDDARVGILRLTTLLYALPDGSPVQGVGLAPSFLLPGAGPPGETLEREADIPHAPPTWRGPDVRDRTLIRASGVADAMTWGDPGDHLGPCKDPEVCQALQALGSPGKRPTAIKKR